MKHKSSTQAAGWLALMVAMVAAPVSLAATLRIVPQVSETQVVVPVVLEGDTSSGVAALDFYLNYDPAVLEPAGIAVGSAASSAGKQVLSNMTTPGRYKVILFGVNQNVVSAGEVARVTLRMTEDSAQGKTSLKVTGTHLASAEGLEMPSSGSSETLTLGRESSDDTDEEVDEEDEATDDGADAEADDDGEETAEDAAMDAGSIPGPTRGAATTDRTAGSAALDSGAAQRLAAGAPRLDAPLTAEKEAALARLGQMRGETRLLRNGIVSPAAAAGAASGATAPLEAGTAPDGAAEPGLGQSTARHPVDFTGAPPGTLSAAVPLNPTPIESTPPSGAEGPGATKAADNEQASQRARVLIAAALAAMGGMAAGLLVLRRRLFS